MLARFFGRWSLGDAGYPSESSSPYRTLRRAKRNIAGSTLQAFSCISLVIVQSFSFGETAATGQSQSSWAVAWACHSSQQEGTGLGAGTWRGEEQIHFTSLGGPAAASTCEHDCEQALPFPSPLTPTPHQKPGCTQFHRHPLRTSPDTRLIQGQAHLGRQGAA